MDSIRRCWRSKHFCKSIIRDFSAANRIAGQHPQMLTSSPDCWLIFANADQQPRFPVNIFENRPAFMVFWFELRKAGEHARLVVSARTGAGGAGGECRFPRSFRRVQRNPGGFSLRSRKQESCTLLKRNLSDSTNRGISTQRSKQKSTGSVSETLAVAKPLAAAAFAS